MGEKRWHARPDGLDRTERRPALGDWWLLVARARLTLITLDCHGGERLARRAGPSRRRRRRSARSRAPRPRSSARSWRCPPTSAPPTTCAATSPGSRPRTPSCAARSADRRPRPQPARRARRPDPHRRRSTGYALVPARVVAHRARAVVLAHRHHRRRHQLRRARRHDRAQQRRPGRPRHPRDPHHRHRAAHRRRRLRGRRPARLQHGDRLPAAAAATSGGDGRLDLDLVDHSVDRRPRATWSSPGAARTARRTSPASRSARSTSVYSSPRELAKQAVIDAVRRLHLARPRRRRRARRRDPGRPRRDQADGTHAPGGTPMTARVRALVAVCVVAAGRGPAGQPSSRTVAVRRRRARTSRCSSWSPPPSSAARSSPPCSASSPACCLDLAPPADHVAGRWALALVVRRLPRRPGPPRRSAAAPLAAVADRGRLLVRRHLGLRAHRHAPRRPRRPTSARCCRSSCVAVLCDVLLTPLVLPAA